MAQAQIAKEEMENSQRLDAKLRKTCAAEREAAAIELAGAGYSEDEEEFEWVVERSGRGMGFGPYACRIYMFVRCMPKDGVTM